MPTNSASGPPTISSKTAAPGDQRCPASECCGGGSSMIAAVTDLVRTVKS
jgi:hypothetical protein